MAIYNKRIKFTRETLLNHYMKRESLPDFLYGLVRFFGIIVQNIYCVSSYLVLSWIVLFPVSWIKSDLYSKIENYLYNSLLFIVSSWSLAAGLTVVETGDEFRHLVEEPDGSTVGLNQPMNRKLANGYITDNLTEYNSKLKKTNGDTMKLINQHDGDKSPESMNKSLDALKAFNQSEQDLNQTNELKMASSCPDEIINYSDSKLVEGDETNDTRSTPDSCTKKSGLLESNAILNSPTKKPRILLLCNHISTADVPLIMQSFSTLTNQSILWVLDAQVSSSNLLYFLAEKN